MTDDTITIRLRLAGGAQAAGEAKAVSGEIRGIGLATEETAAMTATATSGISRGVSRMRGAWTAVRKVAKWAALGIAGAAVAVGVWGKKAVSQTEDLAKGTIGLNKNLGLSVRTASEWAAVAQTRGVDTTKLGMAFKTLAAQVTSARDGSSTAVTMFKRLGFSTEDIGKAAKDTNYLLMKTSDGLDNLKAGADKTAIQGKLFGRSWAIVAPILRDGSKSMQEQLDLANKYGASFGGKTLDSVYDLVQAQREMQFAQIGLQIAFTKNVVPALLDVIKWFAHFQNQIRQNKGLGGAFVTVINAIGTGIDWLVQAGGNVVKVFNDWTDNGQKVIDAWNWIKNAAGNVADAVVDFTDGGQKVIDVGVGIVDIGKSIAGALVDVYGALKSAVEWVERAASNVADFVSSLWPLKVILAVTVGWVEHLIDVFTLAWKLLRGPLGLAFSWVVPIVETFWESIKTIGKVFGDVVGVVSNLLRGKWGAAWRDAKQIVVDIFDGIKTIGGNMIDFFAGLPDKIWNAFQGIIGFGTSVGEGFVNAMIDIVNTGIGLINDAMNAGNLFSFLGVQAPQLGTIGHVGGDQTGGHPAGPRGPAGSGGRNHPAGPRGHSLSLPRLPDRPPIAPDTRHVNPRGVGRRRLLQPIQLALDGRVFAEHMAEINADDLALL